MNGDEFRDVRAGDPVVTSARRHNELNRLIQQFRAQQRNLRADSQVFPDDADILPVVNNTGSNIAQFGILGITTPVNDPDPSPDAFKSSLLFNGELPAATNGLGNFGIAPLPIAKDAVGILIVSGLARVQLTVVDESDTAADVIDGAIDQLQSGSGPASIVYKQPGTGAGKWALVKLGGGAALPVGQYARMVFQDIVDNKTGFDWVLLSELLPGET